jgi:ABC-2 type transport system permease protein
VAAEVIRTNEPPRLHVRRRVRELFGSREILVNLTRKELKVKYKSSVLGVAWSMLNPALYLVVFYVVFTVFLPSNIPNFQVYLVSGLLPWTLFSAGLASSTGSVTGNAQLVPKVAFPREVLPLAAIGAQIVNFFYQFLVLVGAMLIFGYPFLGANLLLLPFALLVLLLFVAAMGFATSALNVRYRDTGHLVDLALLAWFWSTPIVYSAKSLLADNLSPFAFKLYLLNPVTNVVLAFQRALYGGTSSEAVKILPAPGLGWYALRLGALGLVSLGLLYLTWRLFFRMSGDFAEEL